jgi:anti-sigma factor RsiW
VTSLLLDYLEGELAPEIALSLQRHLRDCPDCVAFLKTYKTTVQATRSLRYEDLPARLKERVRRFLRERTRQPSAGR